MGKAEPVCVPPYWIVSRGERGQGGRGRGHTESPMMANEISDFE